MKYKQRALVLGIIVLVLLPITLAVAEDESVINSRMADFPKNLRQPVYLAGTSYNQLVERPTPDNLYSYARDHWDYALELVNGFGAVKSKLISGDKAVMIVAEPTGFVAATVNFELMTLTAGYDSEASDNQLVITSEFLASVIRYGDSSEDPDDFKRYVLEYYDKEWYIVSYGRKMPYFVVALIMTSMILVGTLAQRRGR